MVDAAPRGTTRAGGRTRRPRIGRARLALVLVLAAGAWLRFDGLDWDGGHLFHPDERNLVEAALRVRLGEARDPGFYAYNGLPLYTDRALAGLASRVAGEPGWRESPVALARAGRVVSALASLAAVALAWALGRSLAGEAFGALWAALLAFDVGLVQAAHFATTECLLVAALLATALAAARLARGERSALGAAAACGLFVGLAAGAKSSGASYLLLVAVALALGAGRRGAVRTLAAGVVALGVAVLVFAAVSPHSLVHAARFLDSMRAEHAVVRGTLPVFWTHQFRGAAPYRFELASLHWLEGPLVPALGLAGVVGLAAAARRELHWRPALPLLVFGVTYALYVGSWHAKFVRYLLPLAPILTLGAAWAIRELGARRLPRGLAAAVAAAAVGSSLAWCLAFTAVYRVPDPRITASEWLLREAAPGSVIVNERRDHPLPVWRGAPPPLALRWLDGLAPDDEAKLLAAVRTLAEADLLVFASDRVHRVTRAHPDLFPYTSALYRQLFAGELGFELATRFESPPRLLGVSIPDDDAEETFRVFDHPTVLVFRNAGRRSAEELREAIRQAAPTPRREDLPFRAPPAP